MPETTLTLPTECVKLAKLIARECASHEAHTQQKFAEDLVLMILRLRSSFTAADDQKCVDLIESIARITLALAGLPAERVGLSPEDLAYRTSPDAAGCSRMVPDETGQRRTVSNAAERSGTVRDAAGTIRTVPDEVGQARTEAAR